jgi:hypothetical protein
MSKIFQKLKNALIGKYIEAPRSVRGETEYEIGRLVVAPSASIFGSDEANVVNINDDQIENFPCYQKINAYFVQNNVPKRNNKSHPDWVLNEVNLDAIIKILQQC